MLHNKKYNLYNRSINIYSEINKYILEGLELKVS